MHFENKENKYLETIQTITQTLNEEKNLRLNVDDFILRFAKRVDLEKIPDYFQFFGMLENLFEKFDQIQSLNLYNF